MHHRTTTLLGFLALALAAPLAAAQQPDQPPGDPPSQPLPADELGDRLQQLATRAVAARDVPPGYWLMDGDMQMPLSFDPRVDGNFLTNTWPNGVIPYTFAAGFSAADVNSIIASMQVWQGRANVAFIARTNQADFVLIQPSSGNNSAVGHAGGQQVINFAAGQVQRVYIHELGHCLGLLHEQQRPDRDFSIQIVQANVQAAFYNNNFPIVSGANAWGPYDFGSVMHYDRCAFSIACPAGGSCNCATSQETMQVLGANNAVWQSVIGNAPTASYLDGMTIRGLYPFPGDRWNDTPSGGTHVGTFLNPFNLNVASAVAQTPSGGTLFLKLDTVYHAVGIYTNPCTVVSPAGISVLGD